jgi:hypothetical protein
MSLAFDISKFIALRPFLFHFSNHANVPRLQKLRCIQPAEDLLRTAGEEKLASQRRTKSIRLIIDGETIVITDQLPLVFSNAALTSNWTEKDFVAYLNQHVYFWPGDANGPIKRGSRFYGHYLKSQLAILRVSSASLLAVNSSQTPLFCPFNSGAPRKQAGNGVPRGPDLFLPAVKFPRAAGGVVEVVFRCAVRLPETTELRTHDTWTNLGNILP